MWGGGGEGVTVTVTWEIFLNIFHIVYQVEVKYNLPVPYITENAVFRLEKGNFCKTSRHYSNNWMNGIR